ncbi:MAG: PspA/IM30 family protein [Candidatus Thiodiazotropha sp.]
MALITRVSRLFRADVNAVLDRMEEPQILLNQAVREMEEDLAGDERRYKAIGLDIKQLESRQADLEQRLKPVNEELDLCFDSGNEVLARNLLRRKLESQRYAEFLQQREQQQREAYQALGKRIDENRSRLESMRQKAELLAGQENAETQQGTWSETDFMHRFAVTEDDIELAFLREQQRRAGS